jgi:uncharacterized protein
MPNGDDDRQDWSKRFEEMDISGIRERLKTGFTRRRMIIIVVIAAIILFIALVTPFASFYIDALWYNHINFQNLFWKMFWAKILLTVIFGAAFFVLLYGNIYMARKIPPRQRLDLAGSPLESVVESVREQGRKWVAIGLVAFSAVAALIAGIGWGGKWELVLKFLNHASYGSTDPVFGKDLGFYMFSYPFQKELVNWLISSLVFIFFFTVIVYIFDGGIRLKRGPDMLAPHVKAHLSVLAGVIFVIKAYSYRLNMFELLMTKDGAVYGAGYTDAHARLPALWILTILALVAAVVLIANIKYKGWLLPAIAVGGLVVVSLLAGTVYPLIIQNYRVKPNELELESQYLSHNIELTREAYDLGEVDELPFAADENLDLAAIERNETTIENIRLWDPRPLLDAYQQLQAIRQYYVFTDVDVDRYTIDGEYRQTMVGAREMHQGNLPEEAQTWVNKNLVYTHGYGACLNPTNDVTEEGNPFFVLSDIPPEGPTDLQITRPEIYYGERIADRAIVNTSEEEFDYPEGDERVYTMYEGRGGVRVNSIWRKFLFTVRFADVNLLFSGQVKNSSQVMYYRDVADRVRKCAPFLKFDRDPYMVIDDSGKLFWIVDAYATSESFPYSQGTEGFGNYVRNSVKAVVDAYDGSVWLYVVDPGDPVIQTYEKIFPQIFTPFDEMPEDLRKHVRYPADYFMAQANMLRTYHMTDVREFYNKEDEWDFPMEIFDGGEQMMEPYYVIMKLPGEEGEEMVMMIPFVPHRKQNMIAWLGARMDEGKYGDLVNFTFPGGKLIYGPEQIEGRIEQDPEISRQLSLWRQEGSQVIRGNLLVIPIEESLLFIEPLYLQATQIKIPQIKRVVAGFGQQVVMEETLEEALAKLFGAPTEEPQEEPVVVLPTEQAADLAQQALDFYNQAVDAQKSGDWATYGQRLNDLEGVLQELRGETGTPQE